MTLWMIFMIDDPFIDDFSIHMHWMQIDVMV